MRNRKDACLASLVTQVRLLEHSMEGENQLKKLYSDLHTHTYTTYEWAHICTHKHMHTSNRHRHLYNNTIMSDELSGMGSWQPVTLPWFRGREHCCTVKYPTAQSIASCACTRHASLIRAVQLDRSRKPGSWHSALQREAAAVWGPGSHFLRRLTGPRGSVSASETATHEMTVARRHRKRLRHCGMSPGDHNCPQGRMLY